MALKEELTSHMSDIEISVINDFINSFSVVFANVLPIEEIYNRLNKLKHIGFEKSDPMNRYSVSSSDNANYVPGRCVSISKKFLNADINTIKSVFYHELIHALSRHIEVDEDSKRKTAAERTGLNRKHFEPERFPDLEESAFNEGESLDEIMVEYYANCLLKYEGITVANDYVISTDAFEKELIASEGTGYLPMYGLGQIYHLFFGNLITEALFTNGNAFRTYFNSVFDNKGIFENIPSKHDISSYTKFVQERDVLKRYEIASKMFIVLLKAKYTDKEIEPTILLNDSDLKQFMEILMKHQVKNSEGTRISDDYYLLMQELELNILKNFNNSENELDVNNTKEEVLVYIFYKKILEGYPELKASDITYQTFEIDKFKGIIININGAEYLVADDIVNGQLLGSMVQSANNLDLELVDAQYASVYLPEFGNVTLIKKDGVWYHYNGNRITLSSEQKLIVNKTIEKSRTRSIEDHGFINLISLFILIMITISISIWIYLKIS